MVLAPGGKFLSYVNDDIINPLLSSDLIIFVPDGPFLLLLQHSNRQSSLSAI